MSRVRSRIDIDAPPGYVFDFFDDLDNARLLIPRIVDIVRVESLPNGGRRVEYTVRTRSGGEANATSEHLEYDAPRRTVTRGYEGGMATTATRIFEPIGSATRVTNVVEWRLPTPLVGAVVTAPLRRPLRRSLRETLATAKRAIETP